MEDRLLKLALVASGGALGSVARYVVSVWAQGAWDRTAGFGYPVGTTLVNITGSFAFGAVWAWTAQSQHSAEWRVFMLSGMLGGFTTFSTLMFEAAQAAEHGRVVLALVHLVLHLSVGAAAVVLGLTVGRLLLMPQ